MEDWQTGRMRSKRSPVCTVHGVCTDTMHGHYATMQLSTFERRPAVLAHMQPHSALDILPTQKCPAAWPSPCVPVCVAGVREQEPEEGRQLGRPVRRTCVDACSARGVGVA